MPSHLIHLSHIVGWLPQNFVVDFRPDTYRTHSATAPAVIQMITKRPTLKSCSWWLGFLPVRQIGSSSGHRWGKPTVAGSSIRSSLYPVNPIEQSGWDFGTQLVCGFIRSSTLEFSGLGCNVNSFWSLKSKRNGLDTWNRLNKFAPWVTPSRKPRKPSAV